MSVLPWGERVMAFLDDHADEAVSSPQTQVQIPSVSGSPEDNGIQTVLASWVDDAGPGIDRCGVG